MKVKKSAIPAGIILVIGILILSFFRTIYFINIEAFPFSFEYCLYMISIIATGVCVFVSAFTRWARIPVAVFTLVTGMVNFVWLIETIRWGDVFNIYTITDVCNYTFEISAYMLLTFLFVFSAIKPNAGVLKVLSFIPVIFTVLSFLTVSVYYGIDIIRNFEWDWFGDGLLYTLFMSSNWLKCVLDVVAYVFVAISLWPVKKIGENEIVE